MTLLRRTTEAYRDHLVGILPDVSERFVDPVVALIESHDVALAAGAAVTAQSLVFRGSLLTAALAAEPVEARLALLRLLTNQYALGLGSQSAPVIAIGTEAAFNADTHPENFVLESVCSSVVGLAEGRGEVVAHLTGRGGWAAHRRPFNIYPNDFYDISTRGTHTWIALSKVFGGTAHEVARDLGERVYQIEMSAVASKKKLGLPPTDARLNVLTEVVRTLPASVLLFHGLSTEQAPARDRLTAAFLGMDEGAPIAWTPDKVEPMLFTAHSGHRRVLRTRALSNSVATALLRRVGEVIGEAA